MKTSMIRVLSVLMVAVLLSTALLSGVFAAYSTTETVTSYAQVSGFGVTITVADKGYTEAAKLALVPGLANTEILTVVVSGEPAVDNVTVTYDAALNITGFDDGYCPLVFTVNETEIKIDGETITDNAGLIAAVEDAIEGLDGAYETATKNISVSVAMPKGANDNVLVDTDAFSLTVIATVAQAE